MYQPNLKQSQYLFFLMLNLFRASFIQMKLTCVWCFFGFIFRFVITLLFVKSWLSLLLKQRKEREKNKMKLTCVWCFFSFLFRFVITRLFAKLWLSLPLKQSEEREGEREREKNKKIILKSKKLFLKGSFIYNIYEILIFRPLSFSSAPIHKYSIRSELTLILDILSYYSIPPVHYG